MTSEVPRHRIGRQVVEVTLGDAAAEPDLHRRVQRWAERSLPSVLERLCGEVQGASASVQRWDRVEVDLGTVAWEGLETALTNGLQRRFPGAMRRQPAVVQASSKDAPPSTSTQGSPGAGAPNASGGSELDLIDCFVTTGTVPWWAESQRTDLLAAALDRVLARHGDSRVDAYVQRWARQDAAVRRLILHLGGPRLGALLSRLLRATGHSLGDGDRRPELWVWALSRAHEAMDSHGPPMDDLAFRRAVWTSLFQAVGGASTSSGPTVAGPRRDAKEALWADVLHRLTGALRLRSGAVADWAQALTTALAGPARRGESSLDGAASQWLRPLKQLAALWKTGSAAVAPRNGHSARTDAERPADGPTVLASASGLDPSSGASAGPSVDDVVYVDNAGLILLWPFLGSLFEHLGWLDGQAFAEPASTHRAVALTHYLAVGESRLAEYQVLLNKILCGVDLDDVLDIGPPLQSEEMEAADGLLDAALGHGPLWKTLSHDGLRSAFLQRSGALSVRDDHWLLRVERQTHDVIIDRLPWSWQWVRLPWMLGNLHVEW